MENLKKYNTIVELKAVEKANSKPKENLDSRKNEYFEIIDFFKKHITSKQNTLQTHAS
jgi:hypothetical protein